MTRALPTLVTAIALLALPGCGWVKIDGPTDGIFVVEQAPPNWAHVGAGFYKVRGRVAERSTEIDRVGACWLDHYDLPEPSPDGAIEVDAGKLRVTGGLTDLVADFEGGYTFSEQTAIFEAGDELTLDVEGSDEVAPMSATLTAPPAPVIAPPPAEIDTGEDLTFTWTSPPGTGTLTIQVEGYWPGVADDHGGTAFYPRDIVRCQADPSQGTLTMPASLLSQVSNDSPHGATVHAYVQDYDRRGVGGSSVGFGVSTTAATPGGSAYEFDADLK